MAASLNPHATLIEKNCETIRAALRVALRDATRPAVRNHAVRTIDALEDITEDLLDEEFAPVGRIQKLVAQSGSVRLAQRIVDITGRKLTYDVTTWRIVLVHSDPARIRALLSGPCTPANLALGVLEQVHEGREEFASLIDEVAPLDPFGRIDGTLIFNTTVPSCAARLLRLQADAFPDRYRRMAVEAAEQMAVDSLALFLLMGVPLPGSERSFAEGEQFLEAIASNHGKMQALATLGTLEDYLADSSRHLRSNRVAMPTA